MGIELFFINKTPKQLKESLPLLQEAARAGLGRKFRNKKVNIIFTDNAGIKQINSKFLKKDAITDIIAFNYNPPFIPDGRPQLAGELYICLPQARKQAAELKHSLLTEVLTLIVHGSLHLSGMEDSSAELRLAMNKKTSQILKKIAPANMPNW